MRIHATQNGSEVFTADVDAYSSLAEIVPVELLDNTVVTSAVEVFIDDELVSVVEPYTGG